MSISIYFGRAVRQLRDAHRLSQETLADRADLNRTYLGEVERGVAIPSLVTAAKIAGALGIPTSELLVRSEALEKLHQRAQSVA